MSHCHENAFAILDFESLVLHQEIKMPYIQLSNVHDPPEC